MITGELKQKVDRVWTAFWSNGVTNPLSVIEQLGYLFFMRRLDDAEALLERQARRGVPVQLRFPGDASAHRWSRLRTFSDPEAQLAAAARAFEYVKALPGLDDTPYARHMKDAVFQVAAAPLIQAAVRQVDDLFDTVERQERDAVERGESRLDLLGDVYEYMLSKLSTAGHAGQFRTPRHVIDLMVELRRPTLADTICDPACGTGGFLVGAANYLRRVFAVELEQNPTDIQRFRGPMFAGFDFDSTMLRIGSMNLLLHGIETPDVMRADSLSVDRESVRERFSLILANPPFKGAVDMDKVAEDLLKKLGLQRQKRGRRASDDDGEKKGPAAKTELLFLAQILGALEVGGRAAVIVPDGVLFGSSKAHVAIREALVEEQLLEGVISMPAGVFRPYAGVSTAILLFTRTDSGSDDAPVWFYDMTADGLSLDDKRQPSDENDIPNVIERWRTRDDRRDTDRGDKAFFVSCDEIRAQKYDLSINRYKAVKAPEVTHERPEVILKRLEALEGEIQKGLAALRGML